MAHLNGNSSCPAMDRAEHKLLAAAGYIYFSTMIFGLVPVLYGTLTIMFGDSIWSGKEEAVEYGIYDTAFSVPGAPESWGIIFIALGMLILVSNLKGWSRCLFLSTMACGFVMLFFAATFIYDGISSDSVLAWPPSIVYIGLATLCASRARLAKEWDR